MKQFDKCILCNSERLVNLLRYKKDHLCKCLDCGLIFARQCPTEEELKEFYKEYGVHAYLSPITVKRYHEILDDFEPYKKTGKLLDVGCGRGYFLDEAKKRGWQVYGTELSSETARICREKGIIIYEGSVTDKSFDPDSFDVITSFEVIEHINDPQRELKAFNALTRKGGLVYVTTPNFNSLLRYKLKENYINVINYPEHLTYYTPKTLVYAFRKFGFTKQKLKVTGISLTQLKPGYKQNKLQTEIVSAASFDETVRKQAEGNPLFALAKNIINWSLTVSGKGDTLKGTFIKQ